MTVTQLVLGKRFVEKVRDMQDGQTCREVIYPAGKVVYLGVVLDRLKYDFLLSRNGKWHYVNSFNNLLNEQVQNQKTSVDGALESWVIVEAATGLIVDCSGS